MKKLIKTSWKHIRRSPYQALAGIGIMTLTLFAISIFSLLIISSSTILSYFESKPQITVFFNNEKKEEEINVLAEKLKQNSQVMSVKYVSKEEALAIYKEQNKKDPLLLEMVTANILPASLEISAKEPRFLADLAKVLVNEIGIEEVVYQKDIIDVLVLWTQTVRKTGIVIIGYLAAISLLILLTIIGMKIALRKEEIEILKSVGATNWYIRLPFVFEGIFYGVFAAFISWIFSVIIIFYTKPFLASFLAGITVLPSSLSFLFLFLGGLMTVGIMIGTIGSFLAVWRYLR